MNQPLPDDVLDRLFRDARTHNAWLARDVPDAVLRQLYELVKVGPTTANSSPMRLSFVKSDEAKARLLRHVSPNNRAKTESAPVTAIVGADYAFYENAHTVPAWTPDPCRGSTQWP